MSGFDSPAIEALVDQARSPMDAGQVQAEVARALTDTSLSDRDRGQLLLAHLVGSQGDMDAEDAARKASEAVALLRDADETETVVSALAISATIHASKGDHATCLDCCLDMASIIRSSPDTDMSFRASANFGASLVVLGAYELAAPLFVKGIHASMRTEETIGLIVCAVNLAMTMSRQRLVSNQEDIGDDQVEHLALIEEALRQIDDDEIGSEMSAFKTAVSANVAQLRGDLDQAIEIWGDIDALTAHAAQSFVQYLCLVEAPLALHRNDYDRADILIDRALDYLSTPHIVPLGRVDAMMLRSTLHERQGKLTSALADARAATELALSETNGLADLLIGQVNHRAALEEAQRALLNQTSALTEQALIDELSQVGNRRAYEVAISKAKLAPTDAIAVLICDIDDFKGVNDRYGHSIGDQVIERMGAVTVQACGGAEHVFRYGGDEFVLLPGSLDIDQALQLASHVGRAFAAEPWTDIGIAEPLTCSIGVWVGANTEIEQGLSDADTQLYAAKHAGRNCVRPISSSSASPNAELAEILANDQPKSSPTG